MRNSNKDTKRAAELLGLLSEDSTDPATKEEIRAWLWSNVSNKAKDVAIEELFRQMEPNTAPDNLDHKKFAELLPLLNRGGATPALERKRRTLSFLRTPMRIAASVVVIGLSGLVYLWVNGARRDRLAEITVNAGPTVQSIVLPDGSSIELGVNSTLTYDKNFAQDRHVHLDGEALLDVGHSADEAGEFIPFSVITDDLRVDVYGTSFRVIDPADDGDVQSIVTLYDGSVSVSSNDAVVSLTPGEEYRFDHTTGMPNIGLILAKDMLEHGFMPLLRFEDSTLGNLVTSLSANYGVKFVIPEDIDISRGKFSGDFHSEDLRSTLNILTKASARLSFTLNGDNVVVKRK